MNKIVYALMMVMYWHPQTRAFYHDHAVNGLNKLTYKEFLSTKPSKWALIDWYAGIVRVMAIFALLIIINLKAWLLWP